MKDIISISTGSNAFFINKDDENIEIGWEFEETEDDEIRCIIPAKDFIVLLEKWREFIATDNSELTITEDNGTYSIELIIF